MVEEAPTVLLLPVCRLDPITGCMNVSSEKEGFVHKTYSFTGDQLLFFLVGVHCLATDLYLKFGHCWDSIM